MLDKPDQRKGSMCRRIIINRQQEHKYKSNQISTAKYNVFTFIPKFLYEQFRRYANIFFLCIGLLQQIPDDSSTGKYVTIVPLFLILLVTALKELIEDIKRHRADTTINSSQVDVLNSAFGTWESKKWGDVKIGDIVKVMDNKFFPADLVLLASSEPQGMCYIETSNLDGDTKLKLRSSLVFTSRLTDPDDLKNFSGTIETEPTNRQLYEFVGNITSEGQQANPLNTTQFLMRGARLMNTRWIYGVVVFTGHESKLLMSSTKAPLKRSNIDKITNYQIIFLFLILVCLALISAIANEVQRSNGQDHNSYIRVSKTTSGSQFPNSDVQTEAYGMARTFNLNEELGQIKCVFSDKTGNITCNMMEFVREKLMKEIEEDWDMSGWIKAEMDTRIWTNYTRIWTSIVLWFSFLLVYCNLWTFIPFVANMAVMINLLFPSPIFWTFLLLVSLSISNLDFTEGTFQPTKSKKSKIWFITLLLTPTPSNAGGIQSGDLPHTEFGLDESNSPKQDLVKLPFITGEICHLLFNVVVTGMEDLTGQIKFFLSHPNFYKVFVIPMEKFSSVPKQIGVWLNESDCTSFNNNISFANLTATSNMEQRANVKVFSKTGCWDKNHCLESIQDRGENEDGINWFIAFWAIVAIVAFVAIVAIVAVCNLVKRRKNVQESEESTAAAEENPLNDATLDADKNEGGMKGESHEMNELVQETVPVVLRVPKNRKIQTDCTKYYKKEAN